MHVVDLWTLVLEYDDPLGTWIGHSLLRVCRASRAAVEKALVEGHSVRPSPPPAKKKRAQALTSDELSALLVHVHNRDDDWHLGVELVGLTSAEEDKLLIELGKRAPALFDDWHFWDNVDVDALAGRPVLLEWLCTRNAVLDKTVLLRAAALTRDGVPLLPATAAMLAHDGVAAWLLLYAAERGRGNAGRVRSIAASYALCHLVWDSSLLRPDEAYMFRCLSCAETKEVAELILSVFLCGCTERHLKTLNFTRDVRPHLAPTSTPAVVDWLRATCR